INGGSAVGSKNYLRMKTVTAVTLGSADIFNIRQSIEGINVQDLNFGTASATQITLSFWARASQTGTYSVSFRNDDNSRSYVTTYTINTANTWEYKTITINGDTSGTWKNDTDTGLAIYFDFGTGSTFTTGSTNTWLDGNFVKSTGTNNLITTLNATLDITLVQLEKGGVATPFEYLHIADSLARCQRYYFQEVQDNLMRNLNMSGATQVIPISRALPVPMRVVPSFTMIGDINDGGNFTLSGSKVATKTMVTQFHSVSANSWLDLNAVYVDAEL
ncbi:MAG: hypothetical protein LC099_06755, partial [Anaerolineales bacterium]|nr:hypothetical protein [Anaerolineales bacterium]